MLYNKHYFLTECEGYKTFLSSKGLKLSRRLLKIYKKVIELNPKRVLDFGSGRGELCLNLGLNWIESFGVDISDDAIGISDEIKKYWKRTNSELKLEFIKIDGKNLPFSDNYFDVVILSDLIEHLNDNDLKIVISELYRVLKTGGTILIHTSPNKIFLNFGLKIYWLIGILNCLKLDFNMKKKLPIGLSDKYHIKEHTSFSIKKILINCGYRDLKIELWKNPHYVYYFLKEDKYIKILNKIYKVLPFKHLFFADIFASAKK